MISFKEALLIREEIKEPIRKWTVWFRTPWGLCGTLKGAVEVCVKNDYDPELAIIPVPVAVSGSTHEVVEHAG